MLSSKITSIFLVMLFSITPLEKEWQLLATTDRITSNTAIFVRKNPIGSAATCFDYGVIVESKKSPTGRTEPTPKPEYLIAQGSVGKVPFSFWWIETSSNISPNLNMHFSPNQLLPNWEIYSALKTKNMLQTPTIDSNLPTDISPNSPETAVRSTSLWKDLLLVPP